MGSSRLARTLTMARPRMFGSSFVLQSSVAPFSARVTSQRFYSILPAANCKIWDEFGNGIANNRQQMYQSQGYTFLQAMYLSSKPASVHVEPAAASVTEEAGPAKAEVKAEQFRESKIVMSAEHPSEAEIEKLKEKGLTYSRYWGIAPTKITREDGSSWPWNCFMPRDTYTPDLSIDLKKHHAPSTVLDKIAYYTVKVLRVPTDIFFQRRYGCRAMMLETVAAVPGMVGGMLLHCKSLRRFQHSGGWIKALLEEAENERMHLMTFMEVVKPKWYEKALVFAVQGVFFNAYFLMYVLSPKLAHRVVGYLEEEAIHSYTEFLKDIDKGTIPNVPAPAIAIDYWRLPKDAKLRDVVMVVRADEAHHRDVNHFASDIHYQGKDLNEAPAPLGYH